MQRLTEHPGHLLTPMYFFKMAVSGQRLDLPLQDAVAAAEEPINKFLWQDRPEGWRHSEQYKDWNPLFAVDVVRFAYSLHNLGDLA